MKLRLFTIILCLCCLLPTLATAAGRFTDNNDGTITDTSTGLVWLKNAGCGGQRTWQDAQSWSAALASGTCGLTDGSQPGEWRLPTIDELKSLISGPNVPAWLYSFDLIPNPNGSAPNLWLQSQGFTSVQAERYWSSSPDPLMPDRARDVSLGEGFESSFFITYPEYVWPVRNVTYNISGVVKDAFGGAAVGVSFEIAGGACTTSDSNGAYVCRVPAGWSGIITPMLAGHVFTPGSHSYDVMGADIANQDYTDSVRFLDNADGTMTDTATNLVWLKNGDCAGLMMWQDAQSWGAALASGTCDLADGSQAGDWRIPSLTELQSLVSGPGAPAWRDSLNGNQLYGVAPFAWLLTQGFSTVQDSHYWSSSSDPVSPETYSCVSMHSGKLFTYDPLAENFAWAVRSPKFRAKIAAGTSHTVTVKTDGTVWTWGDNTSGQLGYATTTTASSTPLQVKELVNVKAIAAGGGHTLALKSDGTVWAWGDNTFKPVQVTGLFGVIAIAAGANHSLAIRNDGTVWAWGENSGGQLGDGSTTSQTIPVRVTGLPTSAIQVAAGEMHSVALLSDGTVWSWGDNSRGQIGEGTTTQKKTPVQASGLSGIAMIAAGANHTLAQSTEGTVFAWGDNSKGQAGVMGGGTVTTPTVIVLVSKALGISAGGDFSVARFTHGTIRTWGGNDYGQLGIGRKDNYGHASPQIVSLIDIADIAAGGSHVVALKSDMALLAWGSNSSGQLGDGSTLNRYRAIMIGSKTVVSVAAGYKHTVALESDGTVYSWGLNSEGQLGNNSTVSSASPVKVWAEKVWDIKNILAITAGSSHSVALDSDGAVWTWGANPLGQLGNGSTAQSNIPVKVSSVLVSNVVAIAAGQHHTVALRSGGTVVTWGGNYFGQLGTNALLNNNPNQPSDVRDIKDVVAVAAGVEHTVVLDKDGAVWTWGSNSSGQLGNDSTVNSPIPVKVSNLTNVVAIAAGENFTVALQGDGKLWAWGANDRGQLGDGTIVNRLTPVHVYSSSISLLAAGGKHSVCLSPGKVFTCGNNDYGQLGYATYTTYTTQYAIIQGTSTVVALAAGGSHTVALGNDGSVWSWGLNDSGQLGVAISTTPNPNRVTVVGLPASQFFSLQSSIPSGADTTLPLVTATPPAGFYAVAQQVTLASEPGAVIYYTTDSPPVTPATSWLKYNNIPITVPLETVLTFYAVDAYGNTGVPVTQYYESNQLVKEYNGAISAYLDGGVAYLKKLTMMGTVPSANTTPAALLLLDKSKNFESVKYVITDSNNDRIPDSCVLATDGVPNDIENRLLAAIKVFAKDSYLVNLPGNASLFSFVKELPPPRNDIPFDTPKNAFNNSLKLLTNIYVALADQFLVNALDFRFPEFTDTAATSDDRLKAQIILLKKAELCYGKAVDTLVDTLSRPIETPVFSSSFMSDYFDQGSYDQINIALEKLMVASGERSAREFAWQAMPATTAVQQRADAMTTLRQRISSSFLVSAALAQRKAQDMAGAGNDRIYLTLTQLLRQAGILVGDLNPFGFDERYVPMMPSSVLASLARTYLNLAITDQDALKNNGREYDNLVDKYRLAIDGLLQSGGGASNLKNQLFAVAGIDTVYSDEVFLEKAATAGFDLLGCTPNASDDLFTACIDKCDTKGRLKIKYNEIRTKYLLYQKAIESFVNICQTINDRYVLAEGVDIALKKKGSTQEISLKSYQEAMNATLEYEDKSKTHAETIGSGIKCALNIGGMIAGGIIGGGASTVFGISPMTVDDCGTFGVNLFASFGPSPVNIPGEQLGLQITKEIELQKALTDYDITLNGLNASYDVKQLIYQQAGALSEIGLARQQLKTSLYDYMQELNDKNNLVSQYVKATKYRNAQLNDLIQNIADARIIRSQEAISLAANLRKGAHYAYLAAKTLEYRDLKAVPNISSVYKIQSAKDLQQFLTDIEAYAITACDYGALRKVNTVLTLSSDVLNLKNSVGADRTALVQSFINEHLIPDGKSGAMKLQFDFATNVYNVSDLGDGTYNYNVKIWSSSDVVANCSARLTPSNTPLGLTVQLHFINGKNSTALNYDPYVIIEQKGFSNYLTDAQKIVEYIPVNKFFNINFDTIMPSNVSKELMSYIDPANMNNLKFDPTYTQAAFSTNNFITGERIYTNEFDNRSIASSKWTLTIKDNSANSLATSIDWSLVKDVEINLQGISFR